MASSGADRYLRDIAGSLKSIDSSLKDIAKSLRRRNGRTTWTNYIEGENDGATTPAGSTQPGTDYTRNPYEGSTDPDSEPSSAIDGAAQPGS